MQLLTSNPAALPVTVADLESFLSGTDDGFYSTALAMAGEYFVTDTGIELLERDYTGRLIRSQNVATGIQPISRNQSAWADLPRWPVVSINSMTADGVTVAVPELDTTVKPARLYIGGAQDVYIDATFGHADAGGSGHGHGHDSVAIDERICTAILMLAGFIVEHRGACDLAEAASKSGAAMLMNQLRLNRITL